jgi:hypothetical protein
MSLQVASPSEDFMWVDNAALQVQDSLMGQRRMSDIDMTLRRASLFEMDYSSSQTQYNRRTSVFEMVIDTDYSASRFVVDCMEIDIPKSVWTQNGACTTIKT